MSEYQVARDALKDLLKMHDIYAHIYQEYVDAGSPDDDIVNFMAQKYGVAVTISTPGNNIIGFHSVDEQRYGWFVLKFY